VTLQEQNPRTESLDLTTAGGLADLHDQVECMAPNSLLPNLTSDLWGRMVKSGVDCEFMQLAEPEAEMECGDDGRVSDARATKSIRAGEPLRGISKL
jgi:hypothetical protein